MKDEEYKILLTEEVKKRLKDKRFLEKEFASGKSAQEILEIDNKKMANFYRAAYQLFEYKRYEDAANAFYFLVTLNAYNYDYWLGLGMASQMCKEYETAIDAYEMAINCELENPVPYFYLAKCFFAVHDRENALSALELALEYSEGHEEFQELLQQALTAKNIILRSSK